MWIKRIHAKLNGNFDVNNIANLISVDIMIYQPWEFIFHLGL